MNDGGVILRPTNLKSEVASFRLCVARSMTGLEQLGGWVDQVAASLKLDHGPTYALRLCLEEAAANVVMHGIAPPDIAADCIAVELDLRDGVLELAVIDHCAAFNPLHAAPRGPQNDQIGGWGLGLLREFSRSIHYERRGNDNRLTVTINPDA
jgi:anti-sigma regulatory factor (Ser/Thr protein kinase)